MLGQWGASQCKLTIKRRLTGGPPNAPYTIEKKGSSTPLVDSGRLINAITYEIGMGNGGEAVTVVANTYGPEQEDES